MSLQDPAHRTADEIHDLAQRGERLCRDRFGIRLAEEGLSPMRLRFQSLADDLAAWDARMQELRQEIESLEGSLP